jgi:hypothetical protein
VFHNIVRQISPKTFAFLDHDLIPLCPADLGARVANQPVYGRFMHSHQAWFVWAGYCVYDFGSVSQVDLDFNIDKSRHLDTGGRNWLKLYRHLDAEKLELADTVEVTPVGQNPEESMFELMDEFMHLRGGAGAVGAGFAARKAIAEHLVDAIERRVPASTAMADVGLYAPMPSHKTIRPLPSSLEAPPNSHI